MAVHGQRASGQPGKLPVRFRRRRCRVLQNKRELLRSLDAGGMEDRQRELAFRQLPECHRNQQRRAGHAAKKLHIVFRPLQVARIKRI